MKKPLSFLIILIGLFGITVIVLGYFYTRHYNKHVEITRSTVLHIPIHRINIDHAVIFINGTHVIPGSSYTKYKLDHLRDATHLKKNAGTDTLYFLQNGIRRDYVVMK